MSIKAKTHNLNKPEDGNYGKSFNYICKDHDVQTCFEEGFFDTLAGNFMAGDSIRCLKIKKERISELCEGIVLFVNIEGNNRQVDFRPLVNKITTFPERNYLHEHKQDLKTTEAHELESREEYIKEDGVAKWNPKKKVYEIFQGDIIIHATRDKTQADAIARGDKPVPEKPKGN